MAIAVDGSSPAVAAGSGATLVSAAFTPPSNCVIWAFAQGDANNGSADEALSFTDSASGSWSTPVQDNARGGAVVAAAYRLVGTSPGSMTVTLTDNKGSVAKRLFVRVFTGTDLSSPQGATATAGTAAISYTSTVANSWGWSVYLGSNATVVAGTATTLQDETGGFDSGDAVATFSATSTTTTPGTTVTITESGGTAVHHVAVEIVPPGGTPALPLGQVRRRPAAPRPARGRVVSPPIGQQFPIAEIVQPRRTRGVYLRRPRGTQTVRPQVNPPIPAVVTVQPRRLRGMLARRGHLAQVVPPQVNPPFPTAILSQVRRLRGLLLRRGRNTVPTITQAAAAAPAFPPAVAVQPRRPRGLLARRGRALAFPPADLSLPTTTAVRRLRGAPTRRGRLTVVVQPQLNPPIPLVVAAQPRRTRGLLARRGRIVSPVQAQQTFANPPWVPPWRRDWTVQQLLRRPGRLWQPPWVGVAAPGNPVLPLGMSRRAVRLLARRPGRVVQPPWVSAVPTPALPLGVPRRAVRLLAVRRSRPTAPPLAQAVPLGARRPRPGVLQRRRAAYVLPVAHPGGHIVPTQHRVRLTLPARRGRPLVPLAATALPVSSPKPARVRPLAVRRARSAQLRLIGLAPPPRTGRLASAVIGAGNSSGPRTPGMSSGPRAPGSSSTTTRPGMSSGTTSAGMVSGT